MILRNTEKACCQCPCKVNPGSEKSDRFPVVWPLGFGRHPPGCLTHVERIALLPHTRLYLPKDSKLHRDAERGELPAVCTGMCVRGMEGTGSGRGDTSLREPAVWEARRGCAGALEAGSVRGVASGDRILKKVSLLVHGQALCLVAARRPRALPSPCASQQRCRVWSSVPGEPGLVPTLESPSAGCPAAAPVQSAVTLREPGHLKWNSDLCSSSIHPTGSPLVSLRQIWKVFAFSDILDFLPHLIFQTVKLGSSTYTVIFLFACLKPDASPLRDKSVPGQMAWVPPQGA